MLSVRVYEFVYDVLCNILNSEDYIRNVMLGVDKFTVELQDDDLIKKGLLGFQFENPMSEGWEGLVMYVNTNYYSIKNKNLDTFYLDYCIINLKDFGDDYFNSNLYYVGKDMYPFTSSIKLKDKIIHYDYFNRHHMIDCENCTLKYDTEINNWEFSDYPLRFKNKHIFDNYIFEFRCINTYKSLFRKYYEVYETLNNKKDSYKINKLTISIDFMDLKQNEISLMIREKFIPKMLFKGYFLSRFSTYVHFKIIKNINMDINECKNLCEELKSLGFLSSYEIVDE